jgi:hypothetical protein
MSFPPIFKIGLLHRFKILPRFMKAVKSLRGHFFHGVSLAVVGKAHGRMPVFVDFTSYRLSELLASDFGSHHKISRHPNFRFMGSPFWAFIKHIVEAFASLFSLFI